MNHWIRLAPAVLCIAALPLLSQVVGTSSAPPGAAQKNVRPSPSAVHQSDGARKCAQNCGRCHNPPQGFSPRISGTITLHMRVRASLSKQDQQDILRFLNP
jgi:mono/diheme cytochrome c family protein